RSSGTVAPSRSSCAGNDLTHTGYDVRECNAVLLAVAQILDDDLARLEFAIAEHERDDGTGLVGRLHRALEAAPTVGEVDADTRGAQLVRDGHERGLRGVAHRHPVHLAPRGAAGGLALGGE